MIKKAYTILAPEGMHARPHGDGQVSAAVQAVIFLKTVKRAPADSLIGICSLGTRRDTIDWR